MRLAGHASMRHRGFHFHSSTFISLLHTLHLTHPTPRDQHRQNTKMDWDAIYAEENQRERFSAQRSAALLDDDDNFDNDVPMDAEPGTAQPTVPSEAEDELQTPLQQMMRHWVNERHAPDILPAQEGLLTGLLDHLRVQVRFGWVVIEGVGVKC